MPPSSHSTTTVIAHIDLDCFYAQVEMLRVGCPFDRPFVVRQWNGLVAVNYAAREYGIKRFGCTIEEARNLCPELQSVHVATYAPGEERWAYHDEGLVRRSTHKVSLEPYREASRSIFSVLNSFDGVTVEKGGVDEAFLDLTAAANADVLLRAFRSASDSSVGIRAQLAADLKAAASDPHVTFLDESHPLLQDPECRRAAPITVDDLDTQALFYAACRVVQNIRRALKEMLGFEASAGISKNRTIAKLLSAKFKPNRQTVLLPGASRTFLYGQPFEKLRGLGGKLGRSIAAQFNVSTCGELWAVAPEALAHQCLGGDVEAARQVAALVRGEAGDDVLKERTAPKSILAQKVFWPVTSDAAVMLDWLRVLARELEQRIPVVFEEYGVRPYSFNVKAGNHGLADFNILNKSVAMPWPPESESLAQLALTLVRAALARLPPSGRTVNCFLVSGTVLKADTNTAVRDGTCTVARKQRRLNDWCCGGDGEGGAARRAQPPPVVDVADGVISEEGGDDDDVLIVTPPQPSARQPQRSAQRRSDRAREGPSTRMDRAGTDGNAVVWIVD